MGRLPRRRVALGAVAGIALAAAVLAVVLTNGHGPAARGALDEGFGNPGALDESFGNTGVQVGPTGDLPAAIAIAPDGSVVAVGSSDLGPTMRGFALLGYTKSGNLVYTREKPYLWDDQRGPARGVAIQPDGKVVIAGGYAWGGGFWVDRYTRDGKLDKSFGTDGSAPAFIASTYDGGLGASAVAIQPDGKIVVAGSTYSTAFALAHYTTNGKLDTGFGKGGEVRTNFGSTSRATAIAFEPDGKIVVAGVVPRRDNRYDWALARYTKNGALDTSFGTRGRVLTNFRSVGEGHAVQVVIQPDGKIVAAGGSNIHGFALARYTKDGTLDRSFGTAGKVLTHFRRVKSATAVGVEPDGKIVAAGPAPSRRPSGIQMYGAPGLGFPDVTYAWALARYTTDGTLDTSFGTAGKVVTRFGVSNGPGAVAVGPDGKIIVAGVNTDDVAPARSGRQRRR